ncbi:glycosyltransferase [Halogeometricum borinquense]|uniref:Glycosyltransferase n=1 Tax=Halogeometricum borinquense TaxID=60847 RepID=A0A482TP49_9EURY|nr:glycosyltransferase family 4 protein [Halogeometricum borinquense]RYJ13709.1 glycosyltransferase [Halogeometricum borinquense]
MRFIGYFPGADFSSDSQYGRQTHVYKLIQYIGARDDLTSTFYLDDPNGNFGAYDVRTVTWSDSFINRLADEVARARALIREIRASSDPVVIYCREAPDFAPTLAARLTDAALIVEANSAHDEDRADFRDSLVTYYQHRLLRELKWRTADRIIAVSDAIADVFRTQKKLQNVEVVENGVDEELFSIHQPVSSAPPRTICYVGGLQAWQNIDLMLRVVAELQTDVRFVVVGGTGEEVARLEALAADLDIKDTVTFVGRVDHDEVPEFVNDSDLCFGPFQEVRQASPLKIYEYLACGREVVTVNDTGLEFLESYPGIHRLSHTNLDDLASKVDSILADVTTNEEGASYVRENRSWRAIADHTVDICRETIASSTE